MPKSTKPIDEHQQELVGIVRVAHQNLSVARKSRSSELARRSAYVKLRIQQDAERAISTAEIQIRMELDAELAAHEVALDEALIAAYNSGVPIRTIATDGFGVRYDGGVHELLGKIREDQRLGSRINYQGSQEESDLKIVFPEPVDMEAMLAEANYINPRSFVAIEDPIVLVEPDENGENGVTVPGVLLTMDARDPYFDLIAGNARTGTPYKGATTATLYRHPLTKDIVAVESKETGAVTWDHPVARWVKEHRDEVQSGFDAAIREASE